MSPERSNFHYSSAVFNERADEYDSWFENSLLFEIEIAAIKALNVPSAPPALEIGVGPGRFARELGVAFGIDPANTPLHLALNRKIKVCQAVGELLPFIRGCFSRIYILFTLCFVQNPAKVLQECHRVLREEGSLILGFVPATSQWGKSLQQKKEKGHPFYEYANFFSITECEELIQANGFSIINSSSSLYQKPGEVTLQEKARAGVYEDAGFIALTLQKTVRTTNNLQEVL